VAYQNLIMRNKGMKRIFLALLIGVLFIVLAGCDEKITYTCNVSSLGSRTLFFYT